MEQDYFSDLTEPTRTAARACSVELKLSREQAATFVSQIKDGKFSVGSEIKQSSGPSDYQGCLDRRLGVKTSGVQNEVTAAQVLERAKAYEELFREYKAVRDQLEHERTGSVIARESALSKRLDQEKSAISSSSYSATASYGPFSAKAFGDQSSVSTTSKTVSAVAPEVLTAWNRCVQSSPSSASAGARCDEILAADVNKQLTVAAGLGRFADSFYYLKKPLEWRSNDASSRLKTVQVPTGFVVKFASVPRVFWTLIKPDGEVALAAVIHDYLYWTQSVTRAEADEIFKLALQDVVRDAVSVNVLYQAVRTGGQAAWEENARLKSQGAKRVLKLFPADPQEKWIDWSKNPEVFA